MKPITFDIALYADRFSWISSLRANESAPVPLAVFVEIAFTAARRVLDAETVTLSDVTYLEPYLARDVVVRVIIDGERFHIESAAGLHVTGLFSAADAARSPSLGSLHANGDASDFAELAPEHALERGTFGVHPTMLAAALGETGGVVCGHIARATLTRTCGAWSWFHADDAGDARTVILYDHAGELVARFDGVEEDRDLALPFRWHEADIFFALFVGDILGFLGASVSDLPEDFWIAPSSEQLAKLRTFAYDRRRAGAAIDTGHIDRMLDVFVGPGDDETVNLKHADARAPAR